MSSKVHDIFHYFCEKRELCKNTDNNVLFFLHLALNMKAMNYMKKMHVFILFASVIGFSSCISVQPSSQSSSYEFDEAYWQPGEHFGEPKELSAHELKGENDEDFYSANSPRRNSYAPGLSNQDEYSGMGGMQPMWDPIMGWRLGYQGGQTALGWGLNSAIGINPFGNYTPYYWNGNGFNSFGSYPGYYSNYPGMVYSPFGAYSPYGFGGYGLGGFYNNPWGYGYNGSASGWGNPYNNNFGWTFVDNNTTTSFPRPGGLSSLGSTSGQIHRKPKSLSSGQSQPRKNIMVQALENVSKQTSAASSRNAIDKLERRQENMQRAGRVLEQVGRAVVNEASGSSARPSSGGSRPSSPNYSNGGASRPAPSSSPARSSAPSSRPSGNSSKRP